MYFLLADGIVRLLRREDNGKTMDKLTRTSDTLGHGLTAIASDIFFFFCDHDLLICSCSPSLAYLSFINYMKLVSYLFMCIPNMYVDNSLLYLYPWRQQDIVFLPCKA